MHLCDHSHTKRENDVMHCRALPNRSATTRYDFEDTPRHSPYIYVRRANKTCTRSMLRGHLLHLHTMSSFSCIRRWLTPTCIRPELTFRSRLLAHVNACTINRARQASPSRGRSCGESYPSSYRTARREARRVWASRDLTLTFKFVLEGYSLAKCRNKNISMRQSKQSLP